MTLDHGAKARECYNNEDYEGYLENARRQYSLTGSEEDLEEYEKARKTMQLSKEVEQIIKLEGDSCYKILGVDCDAPMDVVKKAFRSKATRYHPDRARVKGSRDAMRIIQKAYFEINTEEKRAIYDNQSRMPSLMRCFVSTDPSPSSFTYASSDGSFVFSAPFNTRFVPSAFGGSDLDDLYLSLYRNAFGRYGRRPIGMQAPSMMQLAVFLVLVALIMLS